MPRTLTEPEFEAIKAKVLAELPDNLSEQEFYRAAAPRLAAAIGEAENLPAAQEGSALGRLVSPIAEAVNPVNIIGGLYQAVRHPVETVKGIYQQSAEEAGKAKDLFEQGRYVEAGGHGVAAALPVIGPMAARAGDAVSEGDVAGGFGQAVATTLPVVAPPVIGRGLQRLSRKSVGPAVGSRLNPAEAAAVQFGRAEGIPLDLATATGSPTARAIQKRVSATIGGEGTAERLIAEQEAALTRTGEKLASATNRKGLIRTPEQAGATVSQGLTDLVKSLSKDATKKYEQLRAIEETHGMPVALAPARAAMKPMYEQLKREAKLVPLMGDKARALTVLDSLMTGPLFAPVSVVDGVLSELKSLVRSDRLPELRGPGKTQVSHAIEALDKRVQSAVARKGPRAESALKQGRQATILKWEAADVLESLSQEPVKAYRQMVAPGDSGIELLRRVRILTPQTVKHVGRAYLEELMQKATAEGGFGRAAGLYQDWQRLGRETKNLLFGPQHTAKLDKFFLLAKRIGDNPNPSGTANVSTVFNWASIPMSWPLAKLLYTERGVNALTQQLQLAMRPARISQAEKVSRRAALAAAARSAGVEVPGLAAERDETVDSPR